MWPGAGPDRPLSGGKERLLTPFSALPREGLGQQEQGARIHEVTMSGASERIDAATGQPPGQPDGPPGPIAWGQPLGPPRRGGLAPATLRRVLAHVEGHLAEALGIEQLAALAGLSADHFVRAFRESTGQPPHRYVVTRRVELAMALLRQRGASVSEIALRAGFGTPSSFTRAFHRTTGRTPREFQRAPPLLGGASR